MEVWEIEGEKTKVICAGETKEFDDRITAEDIKRIAREKGIKKFIVEDSEGNTLTADDFPIEAGKTIYIKEYNEAK